MFRLGAACTLRETNTKGDFTNRIQGETEEAILDIHAITARSLELLRDCLGMMQKHAYSSRTAAKRNIQTPYYLPKNRCAASPPVM